MDARILDTRNQPMPMCDIHMTSPSQALNPEPDDRRRVAEQFDLILVGGGLQNGLIALSALCHDPKRRVALIEQEQRPGGNHTWCLHSRDVPPEARNWVSSLLVHSWAGYDVRFPAFSRTVIGSYCAITSPRFAEQVERSFERSPSARLLLGTRVREVRGSACVLDDGTLLNGTLVVDARGPERRSPADGCGFQKFVGLELEFQRPHGVERPIVMDATVPQLDGYRFFYTLPLSSTRLLVEDTRFSLQPELDREAVRDEVRSYAAAFGALAAELREESGVLPMPYRGDPIAPSASPLVAGYRGGYFHPATGYSFPPAVRLAQLIATTPSHALFGRELFHLHREHLAQARYARRLNWLLFNGFEPHDMWNVFERFYRLPDQLIHRFYALSLTASDRARILVGKPPPGFKLGTALRSTSSQLGRSLQAAVGRMR